MSQYTLVTGDVQYLSFYLQEKNPTNGSITPYTLATASSIVFSLRMYGQTVNTISAVMETVATPSNTLGFCRVLTTIPATGKYYSQVEVFDGLQKITWISHTYKIIDELG